MPELPEVETVVRELRTHLPGRQVIRASLTAHDLYRRGSAGVSAMKGAHIESVTRRGKAIVISLTADPGRADRLIIHLGMTGRLEWIEKASRAKHATPAHLHARWQFDAGSELRYYDPRRFGYIFVGSTADVDRTLRIGPDPFELDSAALAARLAGRRAPIKSLLLDQHLVSGLGNIYVDEALHSAHIHPLTSGDSAAKHAASILEAAQSTLSRAIASRGTTLRDYRRTDGTTGEFQIKLSVYGREGEKCPRCGSVIRRIVVSQRGTHFCPRCQRAPRPAVMRSPAAKVRLSAKSRKSRADRSRHATPRPGGYTRSR